MTWTFLGLLQDSDLMSAYDADLSQRLSAARTEKEAQKVLNEDRAWKQFKEAVKKHETDTSDPAEFLEPARDENNKRMQGYLQFRKFGYTVIYRPDPNAKTSTPVLFFRDQDRASYVAKMAALLPAV